MAVMFDERAKLQEKKWDEVVLSDLMTHKKRQFSVDISGAYLRDGYIVGAETRDLITIEEVNTIDWFAGNWDEAVKDARGATAAPNNR
jgi:hypothetical protein